MQLFTQIIHVDFIALAILLYLVIFMRANDVFEHEINSRFTLTLALLVVLVIVDNLDYYYSGLAAPHPLHRFIIMAGYITRVYLILSAVFILKPNDLTKRQKVLLIIPAVLNTLIILSALFTDKVFWIDESNVLHREALSFAPHVVSMTYFFVVLGIAVRRYRRGYRVEASILFVSLGAILMGVVGEIILKTRGLLVSAILLMLAFYYLYLHMEHFKRDTLTGALNRMSFFADIKKFRPDTITAFCEIDMNGLKQINDLLGHAAGDKAIVTVARAVLDHLPNHSYLYRLGGDEFAILFCETDMAAVEQVIADIRAELARTGYVCAMGVAKWEIAWPFNEIYNLADQRMYLDKKHQKALAAESKK